MSCYKRRYSGLSASRSQEAAGNIWKILAKASGGDRLKAYFSQGGSSVSMMQGENAQVLAVRERKWMREGGPEPREQWLEKEFSNGVAISIAFYFVVLGITSRALHILRKCSSAELQHP